MSFQMGGGKKHSVQSKKRADLGVLRSADDEVHHLGSFDSDSFRFKERFPQAFGGSDDDDQPDVSVSIPEKPEKEGIDQSMTMFLHFVNPDIENHYARSLEDNFRFWSLWLFVGVAVLVAMCVPHNLSTNDAVVRLVLGLSALLTNSLLCLWYTKGYSNNGQVECVKLTRSYLLRLTTSVLFVLSVAMPSTTTPTTHAFEYVTAYLTVVHMLNNPIFGHNMVASGIAVILCVVLQLIAGAEQNLSRAVVFIEVYAVLSVGSYQREKFHREAFLKGIAYEQTADRAADMKKTVGKYMEHVYNGIMEKYDLTDKAKFESPAEMAIRKLLRLQKQTSINEENFLTISNVVSLLGDAQHLFKPEIQKDSDVPIEEETERWIMDLVETETDHRRAQQLSSKPKAEKKDTSIFLSYTETEELEKELGNLDNWDFDVFAVAKHTKKPLLVIGMKLLHRYGLLKLFNLNIDKTKTFLSKIDESYQDLPYHNSLHACDVARSVHFFLSQDNISERFERLEILAVLLSSVIHDVDHPGFNNNYFIASKHPRAILYNDQSVLENHHLTTAFKLLMEPETSMLDSLSQPDYKELRQLTINLVLATDLSKHLEFVSQYKVMMKTQHQPEATIPPRTRVNVLKMFIKAADVGHTWKPLENHKKWTERVNQEFYAQGDKEVEEGLPISPFMDRSNSNIPQSQVGFFGFLIEPMYNILHESMRSLNGDNAKGIPAAMEQMNRNLKYWKLLLSHQKNEKAPTDRNSASSTLSTHSPKRESSASSILASTDKARSISEGLRISNPATDIEEMKKEAGGGAQRPKPLPHVQMMTVVATRPHKANSVAQLTIEASKGSGSPAGQTVISEEEKKEDT